MKEENEELQATIDLAESVIELLTENMKLRIKINNAIEYIKNNIDNTGWLEIGSKNVKELLEILGGEE